MVAGNENSNGSSGKRMGQTLDLMMLVVEYLSWVGCFIIFKQLLILLLLQHAVHMPTKAIRILKVEGKYEMEVPSTNSLQQ